ncbi:phage antirepressor KilAC domain-containing protein [Paracoccus homiensis]|uniref:Phage antirepressor protein YoqD, KilAC domain n=1 Tax=Paracoccus homiensis TaxID=364199 RepID=A0A1I0GUK9_9RHOB|nr:phage antirepressor KilAC domain-containing protein [Paracoccus homiensis]SET74882.1 Phage antirepressor protein YoqD, KilAC domain [Paracoccus homiensis]
MKMEQNRPEIKMPAIMGAGETLTMSSREIADLVEARHDNVKRTVERLAEKGIVTFTPAEEKSSGGRPGTVYHVNKRDSFVVVAQLCPEFTARLVDRWQHLEKEKANGTAAMLTGPQLMAAALIEADATMKAQAEQIEVMKEDVAAHERLVKAEGSLNITEAAKNLGMRPKDLFDWLSHNGWIYKRAGSAGWLGYQPKCNQGLLEHKSTTVTRADGSEKITEQVRVTPKGLSVLAKLIFPTVRQIGGAQ